MRKYRTYTDEEIIQYSKEVKSLAGLLKKLNLKPAGGNYTHIKRLLQKLTINTEHWTGSAWNRGQQLKDWSQYTKIERLKPHLIKLRGHKCEQEKCELSVWLGKPIPLEVHHIDGDRTNNALDNLKLLCNNCHAVTDNWRNRKRACDETGST